MKEKLVVGVLGATSATGEYLLKQLNEHNVKSIAIARKQEKIINLEHITKRSGDVRDISSLIKAFEGIDILVGVFGVAGFRNAFKATDLYSEGIKNVLSAMKQVNISRLVMVSSSGVIYSPSSNFFWKYIIRPFCWRMYADFSQMELLISETNIDWTILRPPLLIEGKDEYYELKIDAPPNGPNQLSRIALAKALLDVIQSDRYSRKRLTIESKFYEE